MKETRKIIPFLAAACTVFALFYFNPNEEAHVAKIKAQYVESNPRTWRATWWNYERSFESRDYLFFSTVKHKQRPISIGICSFVYVWDES